MDDIPGWTEEAGRQLLDMPEWIRRITERVDQFTMTGNVRVAALCQAVEYIVKGGLPGSIVECGVWQGGSMMAVAYSLLHCQAFRDLCLFDTFTGIPPAGQYDHSIFTGTCGHDIPKDDLFWTRASVSQVSANLRLTGYPIHNIHLVPGLVEDTIPAQAPDQIALLRLDTDWYESTKHEMEHLYPRLVPGGVLILNDYGFWAGANKAVDEHMTGKPPILLHRLDNMGGRIGVKMI